MPSKQAPVRIRDAARSDVPVILAFIRELARFERLEHEVKATRPLLAKWLFGPRPVAQAVMCEVAGEPVGFALFFSTFSTFLARPGIYLEDLYVRPDHRGAGLGRAMLRHIARRIKRQGDGRLEWSVLEWNEDAIRFYDGLGAKPVSGWTKYRLAGAALRKLASE